MSQSVRVVYMPSVPTLRRRQPTIAVIKARRRMRSNIVISRSFSAYFLGLPLISAANAEGESAFFGGSFSQNRPFPRAGKAILRASAAAAQIARSCPRCTAGKSLFGADRRGVRGLALKALGYALKISL